MRSPRETFRIIRRVLAGALAPGQREADRGPQPRPDPHAENA
jgi:hypothetical protein